MNIQAEKLELMEMLLKTENEAVLKKIRSIFNSSKGNARITIEQYNKEIEAAENRIKKGKFIRHEDVVRESEKW
jgi:hypothetical protein